MLAEVASTSLSGEKMRKAGWRAASVVAALTILTALHAAPPAHASRPVLGTNRVEEGELIANTGRDGQRHCQRSGRPPRGTRAIRLSLKPFEAPHGGPAIRLELLGASNGARFGGGARAAGWNGDSVTIPLHRAVRRARPAIVCIDITPGAGVSFLGQQNPRPGSELKGLRVEYLGAARRTGPDGASGGLLAALLALLAALLP